MSAANADPIVIVAAISLVGVLFTAGVGAWTQVYLRKNVGRSNGLGTVVQMAEHSIAQVALLGKKFDDRGILLDGLASGQADIKQAFKDHDALDSARFAEVLAEAALARKEREEVKRLVAVAAGVAQSEMQVERERVKHHVAVAAAAAHDDLMEATKATEGTPE